MWSWRGASPETQSASASVNQYDWQLTYKAAAGQTNKATVTASYTADRTGFVYLIDDVVPISAGRKARARFRIEAIIGCGRSPDASTSSGCCCARG